MSDFIPKAGGVKIGGLGRAAQKLQLAREKAAQVKSGAKPQSVVSCSILQGEGFVCQHEKDYLPAQGRLAKWERMRKSSKKLNSCPLLIFRRPLDCVASASVCRKRR